MARAPAFPFPFFGSGVAAYYKSASMVLWFDRPPAPSDVDRAIAAMPEPFRNHHSLEGHALLLETDDTLDLAMRGDGDDDNRDAVEEAAWASLAEATADAILRVHGETPLAFAAKEVPDEGGLVPDGWHTWSTKQANTSDLLMSADAPPAAVRLAFPFVAPYLTGARYKRLRDGLIERFAGILAKADPGTEGARDDLKFCGELLSELSSAARGDRVLALAPAFRVALAAESEVWREHLLSHDPLRVIADADAALSASASASADRDRGQLCDALILQAIATKEGSAKRKLALEVARACLARAPGGPDTSARRVNVAALGGAFDEARTELARACESKAGGAFAIGNALAMATSHSDRALLEECVRLVSAQPSLLENPILVANVLPDLIGRSRSVEAAALARAHVGAKGAMTPVLWTNVILAFASANDTGEIAERAANDFEALLAENDGAYFAGRAPNASDIRGSAHGWLALWLLRTGNVEGAVRHLKAAMALEYADFALLAKHPALTPHLSSPLIAPLFARGEDAAIAQKTRQITKNPKDWWAVFSRGLLLHERGDTAGALKDYERVLELNPAYPDVYVNIGNIHWARDRNFAEAIRWYDKAVARGEDLFLARLNRAEARFLVGDAAGALEDATRAVHIQATAHGHYLRALACDRLGQIAEAVQAARAGAALDATRASLDDAAWRARIGELLDEGR